MREKCSLYRFRQTLISLKLVIVDLNTSCRTNWDNNEVKALISIWGGEDVKACLENTSKDAKTYRRIAQELSELGFDRNPNQVKDKMKSIKKAYKACKDCNSRSGSGRVTLPFFDELDAILGRRPSVNPVFVIESAQRRSRSPSRSRRQEQEQEQQVVASDSEQEEWVTSEVTRGRESSSPQPGPSSRAAAPGRFLSLRKLHNYVGQQNSVVIMQ